MTQIHDHQTNKKPSSQNGQITTTTTTTKVKSTTQTKSNERERDYRESKACWRDQGEDDVV